MNAKYYTAAGEKKRARKLPEEIFDGVVNEAALWQTVKAYQSNRRRGTASTKTRANVRGGGRKPWRQKGTGRARHGSIRSPIWTGGGTTFGPSPERNYRQDVPKKVRWLARRSAYNVRAEADAIALIEPLELDAPKTSRIAELLDLVGAEGTALLLTDGHRPMIRLSARNIPGVDVLPFGDESAYDLLRAETVLIEHPALERAAEVAHA